VYAVTFPVTGSPTWRASGPSDAGNSGPSAPVLALVSVTGNSAAFTVDVDNTVGAGDTVRLQIQTTGGNWSSPVSDTTHTITAPEDAANEIDLSLALPNGTYDARALVHHNSDSAWSNVVSGFTISVLSGTYYFLGF
jgi:hypothetical protein